MFTRVSYQNLQHTQTQSTRLVALAPDNNNKRKININPPITLTEQPAPALIKLEDSLHAGTASNYSSFVPPFEPKSTSIQTATITTSAQTNHMTPYITGQLNNYYQTHGFHGNLIQIAPHTTAITTTVPFASNTSVTSGGLIGSDYRAVHPQQIRNNSTPPDVTISTMSCHTPIFETYSREEENLDSSAVSSLPEGKFNIFFTFFKKIYFEFL